MEGIHGGRWNTVVVAASHPMDDEAADLRRGPWTVEEDLALINNISINGEGRWNSLARSAGLKRTGKSCRLRWLNYLRPDVRRGNITPEEQLLILELHSRWGNRWSKIAQHLPGRTDNEIKNYWRTRVQKHAKQLQCDVNSKQFKDVMRYRWIPRLLERIHAAASSASSLDHDVHINQQQAPQPIVSPTTHEHHNNNTMISPENSSMGCCSISTSADSVTTQVMMIGTTPPPVAALPGQQQMVIPAADHHQGTSTSSGTLDWYGGLLSSSETADQTTASAPPPNYLCGYYDFNHQDCYFAPATPLPEFDHQDYFWNMDYGDDQFWPLQQQQY